MLSLLVLMLLGAVAAAGSGVGIGTSTLRRDPASVTFTVAVTLFALFALGCLVWVLAASLVRRRPANSGESPTRGSRRLAAALPLLGLLALLWFVAARHHHRLARPLAPSSAPAAQSAGHSAVAFLPTASLATVGVVAGLLALLVLRSRISRWRRHRPMAHLERSTEETWPSSPHGSLAHSLSEVRIPDPEEEPDPRRAVVAAYLAMTHAAGEAGAPRRIDETPSEFLERLLGAAGASGDAAGHLTAVFELARYTTRPVEESLRSSAICALRRVRAELAAAL